MDNLHVITSMENLNLHDSTPPQQPPKLPDSIMTNILLRLPVKPLARFKLISKSYHSLISSRPFTLLHLSRTCPPSFITCLNTSSLTTLHLPPLPSSSSNPHKIPLPFSIQPHCMSDADLIGSHHGLVCISEPNRFLALFNPTTLTYHVIKLGPPIPLSESHWVDYGFGYDSASDSYKIVRVDQHNGPANEPHPREVHVYNLVENAWRKVGVKFPHYMAHPKGHGKLSNNKLHWMTTLTPPTVYDVMTKHHRTKKDAFTVNKYSIVAFDLSTEKFTEVELPVSHGYMKKKPLPKPTLAVLGGKLAVMIEYGPMECRSAEVWLMKEYGVKESWVKLLTIEDLEDCGHITPIGITEDEKEVLIEHMLGMHCRSYYYWYDVESKETRGVDMGKHMLLTLIQWVGGHLTYFPGVVVEESLVMLGNVGLEYTVVSKENEEDRDEDLVRGVGRYIMSHGERILVHTTMGIRVT